MMVMAKEFSPIRFIGKHRCGSNCSDTTKVSLYSCTVSSRMLMLIDADSEPLRMLIRDVS